MDPQQFKHETLALEITVAPPLPGPPLREPDELSKIFGVRLFTTADKVEVLADARLKLLARVLADETADVVGFALIEHRHDVYAKTAPGEGDSDAVRVSHDLVGREHRVSLTNLVAQPLNQG